MNEFKSYYCLDGTFVGKNVNTIKLLYPIYCKLFNIEPVDDIIKEICDYDELTVQNNKLTERIEKYAEFIY